MDIIIRRLDKRVYRSLKAHADLKGMTVSKAVEQAVRRALDGEVTVGYETDVNNAFYEKMKVKLLKEHRGLYVAIVGGEFLGSSPTLQGIGEIVRRSGARKALVTKVGDERTAGGEWLWSSLELQTAKGT